MHLQVREQSSGLAPQVQYVAVRLLEGGFGSFQVGAPGWVSSITPDAVRDMTIGLDYRGLDGGETGRFDYFCYLYRF
ncbi:hypothetical protein [Zoogloea oryzae]|jgi:hypothetical protein|uniref:hypothetical protein n=1 Tax=Zoogloea oryzae TaxID=310767 RepID=UPI0024E16E60|nr:hypothetical protein [Zoogloea oryzae]